LAVVSGFKKRESRKITPKVFFDNVLHNATCDLSSSSLNSLCIEMKDSCDIEISKQGLDERYSEKASRFLKSVLGALCFPNEMSIDEGWLGSFNSVRVKDSTKFVLPEEYADKLPGFGGVSSKSAACIQYEYDLKTGTILDLNITPANKTDSKDAHETQDNINPNDLIIRDLGYYSTDVFVQFINDGAFLISKLNTQTLVYEMKDQHYVELDFKKLYNQMEKGKLLRMEKQVYIGAEAKLPLRIIIDIVPEEVFNIRMQKVNKYNKRMGYTTSENYADRARFNLIITNIPLELIPEQAIVAFYHVRWQIELVFKIWKSIFKIHETRKMKYYRWLSNLYAKLILIAIYWQAIMPIRSYLYKEKGRLLSIDKCFKTLKGKTAGLRAELKKGKIERLMFRILKLLSDDHWLEKKKNKLNFEQIIYLYYCKSDIYAYI
jgi:hypothetical protein